jgi:hypothetical protein
MLMISLGPSYSTSTSMTSMKHINCGAGSEVSIGTLAEIVARVVGYRGKILFDATKPDGTPRKLMDSSRIAALVQVRCVIIRVATLSFRCLLRYPRPEPYCVTRLASEHDQPHIRSPPVAAAAPTSRFCGGQGSGRRDHS